MPASQPAYLMRDEPVMPEVELLIPKVVHWCWFGGGELPELHAMCVESWVRNLPGWEIRLWSEKTFDIDSNSFVSGAYRARKYAFVSDYVRAWALATFGGLYLDADVEIKQALDIFLRHQAFTGFESIGFPFTAVWGSVRGHGLAASVLSYYNNRVYTASEPPNTGWVSDIIAKTYGIDRYSDVFQLGTNGRDSIAIYPSPVLCLDLPQSYATHHFAGSWVGRGSTSDLLKNNLRSKYLAGLLLDNDVPSSKIAIAERLSWREIGQLCLYKTRQRILHLCYDARKLFGKCFMSSRS